MSVMCDSSASPRGDSRRAGRVLVACVAVLACTPSPERHPDPSALEDTLRRRIEAAYDFSTPGVLDRMVALYPAAGTVVSASGGDLIASSDSLRQGIADFWNNVGRNMRDAVWRWGDVFVEPLGRDAAVLTATWSIPHIAPTGRPHVLEGAWTAVFRRIDGQWLIIHEHLSVPPPD